MTKVARWYIRGMLWVAVLMLSGSPVLAEPKSGVNAPLNLAQLDTLMECNRVGETIPEASPKGRACLKLLAALEEHREPSEYLTTHCDITGIATDGNSSPCLYPYQHAGESDSDYNIRKILLSKVAEADQKTKEAWAEIQRVNVEEKKAKILRYIQQAGQ